MLAFVGNPISQHLARSPEGYLIVRNAIIARTAMRTPQYYAGHELGIRNSDRQFAVYRHPDQVFSPRALASGEGKPVCSTSHPPEFLTPSNTNWYQRGVMMNLHRGDELPDGEIGLLADLLLYDESLIELVESDTMRELSLGYSCDYVDQGDGTFRQEDITINHCCVVPDARAGHHVKIVDSWEGEMVNWKPINDRLDTLIEMLTRATGGKTRTAATDGKRSLADEVEAIRRGARDVEELAASGCGPGSFASELAKRNQCYAQFSSAAEAGKEFSDLARKEGQRQQALFRKSPTRDCRVPVTDGSDEADWAERANEVGRRMRGK